MAAPCFFIQVKCGGSQEIVEYAPTPMLTAERMDRLDLKTQSNQTKRMNYGLRITLYVEMKEDYHCIIQHQCQTGLKKRIYHPF